MTSHRHARTQDKSHTKTNTRTCTQTCEQYATGTDTDANKDANTDTGRQPLTNKETDRTNVQNHTIKNHSQTFRN